MKILLCAIALTNVPMHMYAFIWSAILFTTLCYAFTMVYWSVFKIHIAKPQIKSVQDLSYSRPPMLEHILFFFLQQGAIGNCTFETVLQYLLNELQYSLISSVVWFDAVILFLAILVIAMLSMHQMAVFKNHQHARTCAECPIPFPAGVLRVS